MFRLATMILAIGMSTSWAQDIDKLSGVQSFFSSNPEVNPVEKEFIRGLVLKEIAKQPNKQALDCKIESSPKVRYKYTAGEDCANVEKRLRKDLGIYGLVQYGIITKFEGTPKVKLNRAQKKQWQAFSAKVLPEIEQSITRFYSSTVGLNKLIIKGNEEICDQINEYIAIKFKNIHGKILCYSDNKYTKEVSIANTTHAVVAGASSNGSSNSETTVSAITNPNYSISGYRLTCPHAEGMEYSKVERVSCQYEKEQASQDEGPVNKPKPVVEKQKKVKEPSERQVAKEQKSAEAKEFKDWQKNQEAESKAYDQKQKTITIAANEKIQKEALRFVELKPKTPPTSVDAKGPLAKQVQKGGGGPDSLTEDEQRLKDLTKTILELEKKWLDENVNKNAKKEDRYEIEDMILDPKEPFFEIEIPVDYPLTSEELKGLPNFLKGKDKEWLFNCRYVSLVKGPSGKEEVVSKTKVVCQTPNFVARVYNPHPENIKDVVVNIPIIENMLKSINNECGVQVGTTDGLGIGSKEIKLFSKKGQKRYEEPSYMAGKVRKIPKEIVITGGFKGRVLDLLTKQPIKGVTIQVGGTNPFTMTTDSEGKFLKEAIKLKGLDPKSILTQRLYQDGKHRLTVVPSEISDQGDIYLDPKRVEIASQVKETFTPTYGSGLKKLELRSKEVPDFVLYSNDQGQFNSKDVPVTLKDYVITDLENGHVTKTVKLNLDPDRPIEKMKFEIEPKLTIMTGKIVSPKGPAPGLVVHVVGHPEISAVTDENGGYVLKDIPQKGSKIAILPDAAGDYSGGASEKEKFVTYEKNPLDGKVKYMKSDVSGIVYDALTKAPLAGVKVCVKGFNNCQVTDANGYYMFRKLTEFARSIVVESAEFPERGPANFLNGYHLISSKGTT